MLAGTESSKEVKFHLIFERTAKLKGKKTNVYRIYKEMDYSCGRDYLGLIKWKGSMRQYWFEPDDNTGWTKGCLELVNRFLDKVNKRYRNKLRKGKERK